MNRSKLLTVQSLCDRFIWAKFGSWTI